MKIDLKKDISMPKLGRRKSDTEPKPKRSAGPGRPSLGGPELHMPSVAVPKVVSDLYGDLRDRHLLPLVILLIAAMIAAPIMLPSHSGGEEEAAAVAPAAAGSVSDAKYAFSVVPAESELRDPQKRLGHRRALNPFRTPASSQGGEAKEVAGSESSGESTPSAPEGTVIKSSAEGGPAARTESETTVESSPPASEGTTTPEVISAPPTEEAPSQSESSTKTEVVVNNQTVGYEIEAKAGFVPHATVQKGITPMTKLPNKEHPIVLFMGLSEDHKRALFLMTSGVTAYYGGHCALDKESCQLLELKPGKSITFAYGYGESRYKVQLEGIVPVVKTSKQKGSVTKTTTETKQKHPADLANSTAVPASR
jgi:hypothetical protein